MPNVREVKNPLVCQMELYRTNVKFNRIFTYSLDFQPVKLLVAVIWHGSFYATARIGFGMTHFY